MKNRRQNTQLEGQGSKKKLFLIFSIALFFLFLIEMTSAALTDGLAGYWSFDETGSATIFRDNTTNYQHNGTLVNKAGTAWKSGASCKIGGCLDLLASNDYAFIGTSVQDGYDDYSDDTTTAWSLNFWIKKPASGTGGDAGFIGKFNPPNNSNPFTLAGDGTTGYYFRFDNKDVGWVGEPPLLDWSMITFNWNTTHINVYTNGSLTNSTAAAYSPAANDSAIIIGFYGAIGAQDGNFTIDEMGWWNKSLTTVEITQLWNSGNGLVYPLTTGGNLITTLNTPTNNSQSNNDPTTFNATLTPSSFAIANATVSIWYTNGTLWKQQTNTSSLSNNQTNINVTGWNIGNYYWNVLGVQGNGNGSNSSFATDNYTYAWVPFENSGEKYVNTTYETKNETFYLNITTDSEVSNIGIFLNYNGTRYPATHSCSGGLCQIETTIDIPLVTNQLTETENKTWFWQVTLFGSGFGTFSTNTSSYQQNVTNIAIKNTAILPLGINFTIHNETNLTYKQLATFKSTMGYYLGSGDVKEYYNFTGVAAQTFSFNISHNLTFYTTSEIEIQNGTSEREYYFLNDLITNTTTSRKLFLPDVSFSNIIIEVKDQGLIPIEDIIVNISRFYPDLNMYEQIESQKTDEFGQFVAKLVENDVKYKFAFYNSNGLLLKTSDKISIACRSSVCIVPFVIESEDGYFDRYANTTLFSYGLEFDNTTNTFTYSWDDQTGESARYRLEVVRFNLNQSTIVCNTTSTSTVASLTCAVGDGSSTYRAQAFRMVNGDNERRVTLLNVVVGSPASTYGVEGLVWAFVLLFTCIGLGAFNPTAGAVLYGAGFIILGVMGIISMPLGVFFANTIIVAIFIWAVNT